MARTGWDHESNSNQRLFQASRDSFLYKPGPSCSKLTTSLVNVSFKFQTLISNICQDFLLKKCEKLLHCKSFSHFVNKNIYVYLVIKS